MTFRVMTFSLVSQFIFVGSGFYYLLFWVLVLPVPSHFFGGLRWPSWVPSIFWEDFFPIIWVIFFCVIPFCLQIAEVFIFLYFFILAQFSTERLYSDIIVGVYSDTLLAWIDSIIGSMGPRTNLHLWTLSQYTFLF